MADRLHVPVLLDEAVQWLDPQPGRVLVDGTLGAGGHTRALAERVGSDGLVIALDRDPQALAAAEENLKGMPVVLAESNFCDLPEVLTQLKVRRVDGVLLDLGLSSDQLADEDRGFSFHAAGSLDLRFNPNRGEPASNLVNRLSAEKLADVIYQYGEDRHSRRIAKAIVDRRRTQPFETAADLADVVRRAAGSGKRERIDAATRTFQALRIAVNEELQSLEIALRRIPECLKYDGRLAVISYHSLEDRRVKEAFRGDPRLESLTKKPIRPTETEVAKNPRSRSARMRVARRKHEAEP